MAGQAPSAIRSAIVVHPGAGDVDARRAGDVDRRAPDRDREVDVDLWPGELPWA